jgi:prolipoprotein diacylglyceryltransferase
VARLRPEYLLRPLLPTQLMQTLFATLGQLLVAAYVSHCRKQALLKNNGEPILRVGTVCVLALSIYSVGRLLFFAIREDENFKSNKSYTTAYMALGTLAGLFELTSAHLFPMI